MLGAEWEWVEEKIPDDEMLRRGKLIDTKSDTIWTCANTYWMDHLSNLRQEIILFSFQNYFCFHKFIETFAYAIPWCRCLHKFQAWKLKANIKYLEIIYSNILRDEEGTS